MSAGRSGAEAPVIAAVPDIESLRRSLDAVDYLADEGLATAMFLSLRLPQPLLLEGEAGVGKTEAAKALAGALGTELIRLQCYEGIDSSEALYEWNYPRQLLRIRSSEATGAEFEEAELFSREFLPPRPLLQAIEHQGPLPAVLLVDELDRADDDFEAFLFEMLAESSVTIPESVTVLGSYAAAKYSSAAPQIEHWPTDGTRLFAHFSGVERTAARAEVRLHGSKAGLRLDNADGATALLKTGNHALVPGDAASSELVARITHE